MLLFRNSRVVIQIANNYITSANYTTQIVRQLRGISSQQTDLQFPDNAAQAEQDKFAKQAKLTAKVKKCLKEELRQIEQCDGIDITTDNKEICKDSRLPIDCTQLPAVGEAKQDYVPTFNFAAYVNKSPTLQQFIQLGVDLHSIERRKGLAKFVLGLEFEKNVKPYLYFLQDQGVSPDVFGQLITKNPLLFKIDRDDLQTRVNYLESKKFTSQQRQRIFTNNPFWLMFSTRRIDKRLGHFQKEFRLTGDDVRFLASKQPRLITYNMDHIRKSTFCIREEMGFDEDEIKCLLLSKPVLWKKNSDALIECFAYAHNTMKLSHDMLLQFPEVLTSREFRLRQRHEFLVTLGRAQYHPEKDLYVSPKDLVSGNDYQFVRNVAKSDLETYELFLKTR